MERVVKETFCVIGKQGSSMDGEHFVEELWKEANQHFDEIKDLALKSAYGKPLVWGIMSDYSGRFMPWEDGFTKGLYLAGVEVEQSCIAPNGWQKWTVPGFVYLKEEVTDAGSFQRMIKYLENHHIPLVGAVQDFTDLENGKNYMLYPIERL